MKAPNLLTLSAALVAAWPSASAAGLRTLSWGGYVDDIDDRAVRTA